MMKKTVMMLLLLVAVVASAQPRGGHRDRIRSEKIAYITSELQLTPEEAQVFWPIYNQYTEATASAHREVMRTLFELKKAYDQGKDVSDKDIAPLLQAYTDACRKEAEVMSQVPDYSKAISKTKVGRLYVCEEMFRMKMINQLGKHEGPQGQGGPQGPFGRRPEGRGNKAEN